MNREEYNKISKQLLDSAITVHKEMGPGLVESVYEHCLIKELRLRNFNVQNQVIVPLYYKKYKLDKNYIIDVLLEKKIVIEIKAVETILPVHEAPIISYLKLTNKKLGFLINFNVPLLKNGFKRFVNNF
ncbi:MAG: GxxExxY protein [Candidatus Marinimicrobia bacterium]|jgi:GxxExxY protein|nr:GxxExxY protein [Candidatus Neomarinimicrobiota bacterium]